MKIVLEHPRGFNARTQVCDLLQLNDFGFVFAVDEDLCEKSCREITKQLNKMTNGQLIANVMLLRMSGAKWEDSPIAAIFTYALKQRGINAENAD